MLYEVLILVFSCACVHKLQHAKNDAHAYASIFLSLLAGSGSSREQPAAAGISNGFKIEFQLLPPHLLEDFQNAETDERPAGTDLLKLRPGPGAAGSSREKP